MTISATPLRERPCAAGTTEQSILATLPRPSSVRHKWDADLFDSRPARVIPTSGPAVFEQDHAQKGETVRRKAHVIHCPRTLRRCRLLVRARTRAAGVLGFGGETSRKFVVERRNEFSARSGVELWVVLHYRYDDGSVQRNEIQRTLQTLMPIYDPTGSKGIDFPIICPAVEVTETGGSHGAKEIETHPRIL
jgi:hypothetical protein